MEVRQARFCLGSTGQVLGSLLQRVLFEMQQSHEPIGPWLPPALLQLFKDHTRFPEPPQFHVALGEMESEANFIRLLLDDGFEDPERLRQIGRASCRERVCNW